MPRPASPWHDWRVKEMVSLLAATDNVTYVLSTDLRIIETTPAWRRFALANGGAAFLAQFQLGSSLLSVIPDVLRPFYRDGFERTRRMRERWDHVYECSSPDEQRFYRMQVYPFERELVVTHAPVRSTPHGDAAVATHDTNTKAVIAMCAHCRRIRTDGEAAGAFERWEWIPAYVSAPPRNTSHGLCSACYAYYYPS